MTSIRISLLFAPIVAMLGGGCAVHHNTALFVDAARIEFAELPESTDGSLELRTFTVWGHRIAPGEGMVIAYREFSIFGIFPVDRGHFEKVTISLPPAENLAFPIKYSEFGGPNQPIAFYSSDNSNLPGGGCSGYADAGELRLSRTDDGAYFVDLSLHIRPQIRDGLGSHCEPLVIERRGPLKSKAFGELTPWDGRAGNHVYDESFPPE